MPLTPSFPPSGKPAFIKIRYRPSGLPIQDGDTPRGQDCIRGQVALRPLGIEAIPINNVEKACAGGGTAFHHAWLGVASGLYDITMAVGAEKLHHPNKMMVFAGFLGGLDIENIRNILANISEYGMTEDDKKKMKEHIRQYAHHANPLKTGKSSKKKNSKSMKDKAGEYCNMLKV